MRLYILHSTVHIFIDGFLRIPGACKAGAVRKRSVCGQSSVISKRLVACASRVLQATYVLLQRLQVIVRLPVEGLFVTSTGTGRVVRGTRTRGLTLPERNNVERRVFAISPSSYVCHGNTNMYAYIQLLIACTSGRNRC